jgi:DME family drug/metabolite transporter
VLFGACTVAIRLGLRRAPDPVLGSLVTGVAALGISLVAAILFARDFHGVWAFALAGILAPGTSQVLFVSAVGMAGAARVSVVVGTAPLVAGIIAVVFLDEPLRAGLVIGAALIVAGGIALIGERVRPVDFRALGALLAFGATALFATRDNVVRWLAGETDAAPLAAAAAALLAGTGCMAVFQLLRGLPAAADARRSLAALAPAGVLFGLSYLSLFAAYDRGRVTVVSPLVATESLWGVVIAVVLLRSSELVGRRLVAGAVLIVVGGVLIGLGANQ